MVIGMKLNVPKIHILRNVGLNILWGWRADGDSPFSHPASKGFHMAAGAGMGDVNLFGQGGDELVAAGGEFGGDARGRGGERGQD